MTDPVAKIDPGGPVTIIRPPEKSVPATPSIDLGETVKAHHRYRLASGEFVPSVTTVLGLLNKPALVGWANRLGLEGIDSDKYVDETKKIGTAVHRMIAAELAGRKPDLAEFSSQQLELVANSIRSWESWKASHKLDVQMFESRLVSENYRFGGTFDSTWVGTLDGEGPILVDYKTSDRLYPEHRVQVAAYTGLAAEHGIRVTGARLLRFGRLPTEGFEEHRLELSELRVRWRMFLRLLEVYQLRKQLGDKA